MKSSNRLATANAYLLGLSTALTMLAGAIANAATIGVSVSLSGDAAELGEQFKTGAELALEHSDSQHELVIVDDGCDVELAGAAAGKLKTAAPAILTGMICNAPAKVIADRFSGTQIPAIVAGARSIRLIKDREREQWNLWRLSPGDDYPVEIAAQAIQNLWSQTPYAIVDDGTIYGRSFTDTLRAKMDERGLQPQFSDTFRAAQSTQAGLLRRLQRSGASAAFIASASVEDLYTITRNLKDFNINLEIITSEALEVLPFLQDAEKVPPGVRTIMAPLPENPELEKILAEREIESNRQIYHGYAAIQVALELLKVTESDIAARLTDTEFNTVIGPIVFNSNGTSTYNPYGLYVWEGQSLIQETAPTETQ